MQLTFNRPTLTGQFTKGESCLEQLFVFLHSEDRYGVLRDYKVEVEVGKATWDINGQQVVLLTFMRPKYGKGQPGFRPHKESFCAFIELVEQAVELHPLAGVCICNMLGVEINLNYYLFETGWHPHKDKDTLLDKYPDWHWYKLNSEGLVPRVNADIPWVEKFPNYPTFEGQYRRHIA